MTKRILNFSSAAAPRTCELTEADFQAFEKIVERKLNSNARLSLQNRMSNFLYWLDLDFQDDASPAIKFNRQIANDIRRLNEKIRLGPKSSSTDVKHYSSRAYNESIEEISLPNCEHLEMFLESLSKNFERAADLLEGEWTSPAKSGRNPSPLRPLGTSLADWFARYVEDPSASYNAIKEDRDTPFVRCVSAAIKILNAGDVFDEPDSTSGETLARTAAEEWGSRRQDRGTEYPPRISSHDRFLDEPREFADAEESSLFDEVFGGTDF